MAEEIKVCNLLDTCAFFEKYESDPSRQLPLKGFVLKYCKGGKQNQCVRHKIDHVLGHGNVPVNMMPNGFPLSGTSKQDWSESVKKAIAETKGL